MDQPAHEILKLEQILDAFARYERHEEKKRHTREMNRQRHTQVSDGS